MYFEKKKSKGKPKTFSMFSEDVLKLDSWTGWGWVSLFQVADKHWRYSECLNISRLCMGSSSDSVTLLPVCHCHHDHMPLSLEIFALADIFILWHAWRLLRYGQNDGLKCPVKLTTRPIHLTSHESMSHLAVLTAWALPSPACWDWGGHRPLAPPEASWPYCCWLQCVFYISSK